MIRVGQQKVERIMLADADVGHVVRNGRVVWPYDDADTAPFTLLSRAAGNEISLTFTAPEPAEGAEAETLEVRVFQNGAATPTVLTATAGTPLVLATLGRGGRIAVAVGAFTAASTRDIRFSATDAYEVYGDLLTLKGRQTVASYDFANLFRGSTTLMYSRRLRMPSATASYCCSAMFYGCTSLLDAPELPAMTLANYCYYSMFRSCTSLVRAQRILPAMTMVSHCYDAMFRGTRMFIAPVLPAITLRSVCYQDMFRDSRVGWIKALFTTTPSNSYTPNWLNSIGSVAGRVFVKNENATWNVTSVSGVPAAFTKYTCSPDDYTTPWDDTWEEPAEPAESVASVASVETSSTDSGSVDEEI